MHVSMFWWIVIIAAGFLMVRAIVRAVSAPRSYGYGGFGGGSFWSGLLGGLGGAWLGNELLRGPDRDGGDRSGGNDFGGGGKPGGGGGDGDGGW